MIDIEWWQALFALVAFLGFSAAPWIVALLNGKLLTLSQHNQILAIQQGRLDDAKEAKATTEAALAVQTARGDQLESSNIELTGELGKLATHLLSSFNEAAERADEHGTT